MINNAHLLGTHQQPEHSHDTYQPKHNILYICRAKSYQMQFIWSIIGHMLGFLPTPKCLQILCWQFINSHQINSAFNCKFFLQWTIFFSPMPGTQGVIFYMNQSRLVPLKEKDRLQEGWTAFKTTASQTSLSTFIVSTANSFFYRGSYSFHPCQALKELFLICIRAG